jgi:hypothetical protein
MMSGYLPGTVGGGDLVAELASIATQAGPNTGLWPGLTIYRFTAPAGPTGGGDSVAVPVHRGGLRSSR